MKEMKDFKLSKFLDISSEYLLKCLDKFNGFSSKPKGKKIIKGVVKLGLLIILLLLVKIVFMAISTLGSGLIFLFGTTLRGLLSGVWEYTVRYSYYLFALVSIYKLVLEMSKDRKYMVNIKIRKKQHNIYADAARIIRILAVVMCVPILSMVFINFAAIGILLAFVRNGIFLLSLFVMIISIIIILCSCLVMVLDEVLTKEDTKNA